MRLSAAHITDLNLIARWLARDDFQHQQVDMLILAGHAILPTIEGAFDYVRHHRVPLLLSGGIGHSTVLLRQALEQHYPGVHLQGDSEAAMLASLARQAFDIDPALIIEEPLSRNSGENALHSLQLLQQLNLPLPQCVLLVQDPLMQRRTHETFLHVWQHENRCPQWVSWPVFTPALNAQAEPAGARHQRALWSPERFVAMVLGEVKRLRDDATGYGPQGTGFIGHVTLPENVEHACARLYLAPALAGQIR
ncbi:hypothetical protein CIG19_06720 [Enterobacterales bacterium CwR94]|nr:hypothetical protein CIG19_06720 [Enterobacterales bacterium CwR94]